MRPIDADAAKNKFHENAQKDGNPFVGAIAELFCEFLDSFPTLGETVVEVPRWIPVTERMPDSEEYVLVVMNGRHLNNTLENVVSFANYVYGEWWDAGYPEVRIRSITHWMPLPEPPEVE